MFQDKTIPKHNQNLVEVPANNSFYTYYYFYDLILKVESVEVFYAFLQGVAQELVAVERGA